MLGCSRPRQSGVQVPFIDFDLTVWEPAECDEKEYKPITYVTACNASETGSSTKVKLLPKRNKSCFEGMEYVVVDPNDDDKGNKNFSSFPPELQCCEVTSSDNHGCRGKAPDTPYITAKQLADFKNTSRSDWGELRFEITNKMIRELWREWGKSDEVFINGMAGAPRAACHVAPRSLLPTNALGCPPAHRPQSIWRVLRLTR